ncbi:hypothetical protein ACGE0T_12660 [Parabacteroides sp. APC149_11_2_Y6]
MMEQKLLRICKKSLSTKALTKMVGGKLKYNIYLITSMILLGLLAFFLLISILLNLNIFVFSFVVAFLGGSAMLLSRKSKSNSLRSLYDNSGQSVSIDKLKVKHLKRIIKKDLSHQEKKTVERMISCFEKYKCPEEIDWIFLIPSFAVIAYDIIFMKSGFLRDLQYWVIYLFIYLIYVIIKSVQNQKAVLLRRALVEIAKRK